MTINANSVNHGTAGGTPINADLSRIDHSVAVKVQLSANYAALVPTGAPRRPCCTGAPASKADFPTTYLSGTVLMLLKHEADALVAAGKASYV